jgi:hypothetical protein
MRVLLVVVLVSLSLFLSGCTGMPAATTAHSTSVPGVTFTGRVHGGQQPIAGAHVYLFAANVTGNAGPGIAAASTNASVSLLNSNVTSQIPAGGQDGNNNWYATTDGNGDFTISGDYICPSADSQVYLYAVGGNPGAGTNSAAGLLAGIGSCSSLTSSTFVTVNELSTIATAYAIAGYASDATHVSSSGSTLALTGIANAFSTIANLETLSAGVALVATPAGNGTVPEELINTLADILAACVNSTGPGSTGCSTVLSNTMNGSIVPADTATAAINMAHDPGANVANLWAMYAGGGEPFQPTQASPPFDLSIAIKYSGGGLSYPEGIAIDKSGNVWTANYQAKLMELSPIGAPISGSSGYTGGGLSVPWALAIDTSGNVWATNSDAAVLSEFSSSGSPVSSTGYTGGGVCTANSSMLNGYTGVWGLVIDGTGNVWLSCGNNLSEFSSTGSPKSGSSGYTGGGLSGSLGIAADTAGNIWVANFGSSGTGTTISEFNSGGSPVSGSSGISEGGSISGPTGLALDAGGNVWVLNGGSLAEFDSSGSLLSGPRGYTGVTAGPQIAIDGAGYVWIGGNSELGEFNPTTDALVPTEYGVGYGDGTVNQPQSMAIDGSGNVWVANNGGPLLEFVGLATPVVTPVVANLVTPYGSHAVNRP